LVGVKRAGPNRRVVVADCVEVKRPNPERRVVFAAFVGVKGRRPGRRIEVAIVVKEGTRTYSRIGATSSIRVQGFITIGRIVTAPSCYSKEP